MKEKTIHRQQDHLCAKTILAAFDEYQTQFKIITRRAKTRFENQDWHGMKADADERLDLYKETVNQVVDEIRQLLSDRVNHKEIWIRIKAAYSGLSSGLEVWDLAETFFNSVTRRIFVTVGVDHQIEFVDTCTRTPPLQLSQPPYHTYTGVHSIPDLIEIGVDILNPVQVAAKNMDTKKLKADFGDRITFWGGIDTQHRIIGLHRKIRARRYDAARVEK